MKIGLEFQISGICVKKVTKDKLLVDEANNNKV